MLNSKLKSAVIAPLLMGMTALPLVASAASGEGQQWKPMHNHEYGQMKQGCANKGGKMGRYGKGYGMKGGMEHGPGKHGGMRGGMEPGKHIEGRIAFIKAELAITAEQEPAWQQFEQVMREGMNKAGKGDHKRGMHKTDGNPAEHLAQRISHMEERLAHMKKMQAAMSALFEVLTPEQQEAAKALHGMKHRRG